MKRFLVLWAPAVLYAIFIFVLSSIPGSRIPVTLFEHADKLIHVGLFGGFGLLLVRAFWSTTRNTRNAFLLTIVVGGVYAAADELHQSVVPFREMDVLDLGADMVGLLLACMTWYLWRGRPRKQQK